jgi:hypothetical protein
MLRHPPVHVWLTRPPKVNPSARSLEVNTGDTALPLHGIWLTAVDDELDRMECIFNEQMRLIGLVQQI